MSFSRRLEEARAFDAFVQRHRMPLERYFRRRGATHEEAEDLTQCVFLKLLDKMKTENADVPDGYVFSAAASVFIDHRRSLSVRPIGALATALDENLACDAPLQDRIVEDRENLRVIRKRILALPSKLSRAFILHRFDQLSQAEISRRMNVSVSSVEKYIAAALEKLGYPMAGSDDE
ncbi:RNA polymerase sigma factor [Novosphingobium sp. PhB165]|uniref:RNA polymerase sigma factor n=1 Tax=Novosphingobium sp. PhB165 TaxID=2485105 RepID=UPI001404B822|nr:RNA polymerase sigma factor [Novosphingobium sp. PhB165]